MSGAGQARVAPLRARLLLAFVALALGPPLLALAALPLLDARLEEAARARLARSLEAALTRVARLRERAATQVAAVAHDDLAALHEPADSDVELAALLARRRDLQALEIVDEHGRLVSSAHWPAGLGLLDRDAVLGADPTLRVERVAEDYGMGERVALMPAAEGRWRGAPVVVRGGWLLDGDWLFELGALMQAQVALRDRRRGVWIEAPGSSVASWQSGPSAPGEGQVRLGDVPCRFAARALDRDLWLVAVEDTRATASAAADVRRSLLGSAGVALVAALVLAYWLSARLARPVSALAQGARRVAAGDFAAEVPCSGPRETVELARAFNDMTLALRESRARLVQVERVASWREMARRLAHELKNPLFPIQLSVETLRRAHAQPGATSFDALFRESSATILEALRSLRRVVDDFSQFARMPAPRLAPARLDDVLHQVLALYRSQAEAVDFVVDLDDSLEPLSIDVELLSRALGNLVKNALEAMPAGGRLTLRTRRTEQGAALEVEDTGAGLSDDQRARLFTPYFSTKPGGTGLGLAIVQGIVSDHGGRIEVASAPGAGALFTIVLPRAASGAP